VIVVGISGGSGSGKSVIAAEVARKFPGIKVGILPQDAYYRNNSRLEMAERKKINFDEPASIDYELLIQHIQTLREGNSVYKPVYSFLTCTRTEMTVQFTPPDLLILEGILIFSNQALLGSMDLRIYIESSPRNRLSRILERDRAERGRSPEEIVHRFSEVVDPMHKKYVEPSAQYADRKIYNDDSLEKPVSEVYEEILKLLEGR
jgi:uridine kinase